MYGTSMQIFNVKYLIFWAKKKEDHICIFVIFGEARIHGISYVRFYKQIEQSIYYYIMIFLEL